MQEAKNVLENAVREAKVNVILDAAMVIFSQKEFHETRLEDIAEAAGFSKASLYNYYKDKNEIFLGLAIREHRRLHQRMSNAVKDNASFIDNMRALLRASLENFDDCVGSIIAISGFRLMRLISEITTCAPSESESIYAEFRRVSNEITDLTEQLVKKARKSGEIESTLPDSIINNYVSALVRGTLMRWKMEGRTEDVSTTVDQIIEFVCNGIKVKKSK